jgi:DNA repair protein RadC
MGRKKQQNDNFRFENRSREIKTMKDLPAALRPREKLLSMGPAALADAELLALLLRTGMKGLGVLQMAEKVLQDLGGLSGLLAAAPEQLKGVKGLGPAKRAELLAVMEMARRSLSGGLKTQPVFNSPQLVKDYLQMQLGALPHEVFAVLFLDAQHRLIACEELFRGTLTQTSVYPREVVKRTLALNAASVILAHNHPSGLLEPSRADELLTQTLKSSLQLVDVRVLDHFVVGRNGALSFAERGLL